MSYQNLKCVAAWKNANIKFLVEFTSPHDLTIQPKPDGGEGGGGEYLIMDNKLFLL